MEPLPIQMTSRLVMMAVVGLTGCVGLGQLVPATGSSQPVCQLVTTWKNEIATAPDPTKSGSPNPGIVGRVYLFGQKADYPLVGDGSLTVALFAGPPPPAHAKDVQAVQLEEWRIDKDTLHRLLKRDKVGWGYTLFLPWDTYKPEIKQIHLRVRYQPSQGTPIFSDNIQLTMNKLGEMPIQKTQVKANEAPSQPQAKRGP